MNNNHHFLCLDPSQIPNPFEQGDLVAEASCGTKTSALVSRQGLVALWGLVAYDDGPQMATVTTPTLYHPLRHKFVTNVVTSENVCIALIHVPGMDDVTEGFLFCLSFTLNEMLIFSSSMVLGSS